MADGVILNLGSGGATVASDDVGGFQHQRVKLEWGADGTVNEVDDTAGKRVPVDIAPKTTGGCSNFHLVVAATDNATNVKASAGHVYGISVFNNAIYPVYIKFHNTAGTPTAGAGVVKTVGVQGGTFVYLHNSMGIAFATGIGITIVKGITDANTTAVALSDCVLDLEYK